MQISEIKTKRKKRNATSNHWW